MPRLSEPIEYANKFFTGSGLFTDVLRAPALLVNAPPPAYPGEKHGIIIDRGHPLEGQRDSHLGPGTNLVQRRIDGKNEPLTAMSAVAKKHDEDYEKIAKVKDKKERLRLVKQADGEFIQNVKGKDPVSTSAVARRAMMVKTIGDSVLQTPLFLGSGDIDVDCDEFRECQLLVLRPNHIIHKKIHNKKLEGGLTSLHIALLSSLSDEAIEMLMEALTIKPTRRGTDLQRIAAELDDMTTDKVNRILLSVIEELSDEAFIEK